MTRTISRNRNRKIIRQGFTLTEVLLVLAILGVIAAMVVPNLVGQQKNAMIKATKITIKAMEDACSQYAIAHDGDYPAGDERTVIASLCNPGADKDGKPIAPFLQKEPKDAWGNLLHYSPQGRGGNPTVPAIWSDGPDKKNDDGANDDVSNWN